MGGCGAEVVGAEGRKEGVRRERWALTPGLTGWKPLEGKWRGLRLTEASKETGNRSSLQHGMVAAPS